MSRKKKTSCLLKFGGPLDGGQVAAMDEEKLLLFPYPLCMPRAKKKASAPEKPLSLVHAYVRFSPSEFIYDGLREHQGAGK